MFVWNDLFQLAVSFLIFFIPFQDRATPQLIHQNTSSIHFFQQGPSVAPNIFVNSFLPLQEVVSPLTTKW